MGPVTNARVLYAEHPTGYVEPGKHLTYDASQTIDLDAVPLKGGTLVKTLVLSVDPYMRGKMRDDKVKSYTPPSQIGQRLYSHGVGVVLRSEDPAYKPGDHVYGLFNHEQYSVHEKGKQFRVLQDEGLPWSYYIGTLGMPGQTAYYAWKEYSKVTKGETAFVSTAAGAVGAIVVQLAKLDGLKVIASSGSDEKADFVKSLGADVSFNYKKESTREILEREGGLDVYWDNVAGETLDLALEFAHKKARFIQCGGSSMYNNANPYLPKNIMRIVMSELTLQGFVVSSLKDKYEKEFYEVMPRLVKEGKIRFKEDVSRGLDQIGQAFLDISTGANVGKKLVIVADE